jgi:hypothetical protein
MLTKTVRKLAPKREWFRTRAALGPVLREIAPNFHAHHGQKPDYEGESRPDWMYGCTIPLWVRLMPHEGRDKRGNPIEVYHADVILDNDGIPGKTEFSDYIYPGSVGLEKDTELLGWDSAEWIYRPFGYDDPEKTTGEDASFWTCSNCGHRLYRDDAGTRHNYSACIYRMRRVCRDCDVRGMVIVGPETRQQLDHCMALADFIGGDCKQSLERNLERLSLGRSFGLESQVKLFRDSHRWSFAWNDVVFTPEGKKRGMHGGLIQHGPHPEIGTDGAYTFTVWDYKASEERPATDKEVEGIYWSIHT